MNTNWMERNYNILKDKYINRIFMPGTHDSGAYTLDFNVLIGEQISLVDKVAKVIPYIQRVISDWTVTQDDTIYEQLARGIRVFDFRISYCHNDSKFYITHTFTCDNLETILWDLKRFLQKNRHEVIILQLTPDWRYRKMMTLEKKKESLKIIKSYIGEYLISKNSGNFSTYGDLLRGSERVHLFYDIYDPFIWNPINIKNPWINTSDPDTKYKYLVEELEKMTRSNKSYNISNFTLTPQKQDIFKDVLTRIFTLGYKYSSIKKITNKIQNMFQKFKDISDINKVSVFMTDYPSDEFIDSVIYLNFI